MAIVGVLCAVATATAQPRNPDPADQRLAEATRLGAEVERLIAEGSFDAALPLAQRTLDIYERALGKDDPNVAAALNSVAMLYERKGDYATGQPLLVRALAIYEKRLGKDHVEVASTLNNLAILYDDKGDQAAAEPLYLRALAIREKALGIDHPDVAMVMGNLATLYYTKGDFPAAEPLLVRTLAIREKALARDHPDVAAALNNLAMLYLTKGDYAAAEPLMVRALASREKVLGKDHTDVAASLYSLAWLYEDKGDYAAAEPLFVRALAVWEKAHGADHPRVALGLTSLAMLYKIKGDYAAAEPLYVRALAIRGRSVGEGHPEFAKSLNNLATLYKAKGDHAAAEPLLLRARTIMEKAVGKDHPDVAKSLNNLATLYQDKGDYAAAEPLLVRALEIREKAFGKDHPDVAHSLDNLAMLYQYKADYVAAEPLLRRALAIRERALGKDHPEVAQVLNDLALVDEAKGDLASALDHLGRAAEIREKHLGIVLATGSEAQKRAAMSLLAEETDLIISLHAQDAPSQPAALRLALTTILRRKGRVIDETAAQLAALRQSGTPETADLVSRLAWARSALGKLVLDGVGTQDPGDYRQRLDAARAQVDDIERRLGRINPGFAAARQPVTIEQVQRAIPDDVSLVELVAYRSYRAGRPTPARWGERRYVAYVLGGGTVPRSVDLGPAAALDGKVAACRLAFSDPRRDVRDASRALYDSVLAPILALTGNARILLIAPDGELNLVPLSAAIDPDGRLVIETRALHYLTSGRDLLRNPARPAGSEPVIIADPAFDSGTSVSATNGRRSVDFASIHFAGLPGTRREAETLRRIIGHAEMLLGGQATEQAIRAVHGPRILHLATHGFFLDDGRNSAADTRAFVLQRGPRPNGKEDPLLRAGLAFSGANRLASGADDGILTAEEAKGLDLDGTRLVVLSACDTGVGAVASGDGVYGLRRALVLAGAETLLMSLWKVDDARTAELMAEYYRRLIAGAGRAEALRETQLRMRADRATAHPYYWASFVVLGNGDRLDGRPAPPPTVARSPRGCGCQSGPDAGTPGWVLILALLTRTLLQRRRRN